MFDYLYYRIYAIYKFKWKDSVPGVYAICILSLLQGFNILSAMFAIELFTQQDFEIRKIYYGLLIAVLITFNYYRFYFLTGFSELEKKWSNEPKRKKTSRGVLILFYVSLSVLLTLFLADYMSGIN